MKYYRMFISTTVLILVMVYPKAYSESRWQSLGLEDHEIYCILVDDTTKIMAGTDDGVYLLYGGEWEKISEFSLPVNALVRVYGGTVLMAVGNGSKSDGIYIGQDVFDGMPFYEFTLLDYVEMPTAMDVSVQIGAARDQVQLFVGSGNDMYSGHLILEDGYLTEENFKLKKMYTPKNCFGVEDPYCAVVHIYSTDQICFAGGYDLSPEPGPGNLIYEIAEDSMAILKQSMNVSAIAEIMLIRSVGLYENTIIVGTRDDGILYYENDGLEKPITQSIFDEEGSWVSIGSPNGEPVEHILSIPLAVPFQQGEQQKQAAGSMASALYAAVPSGIFINDDLAKNSMWTEIGDIPSKPNFLAAYTDYPLYAGTSEGVYVYKEGETSVYPISKNNHFKKNLICKHIDNGRIYIYSEDFVNKNIMVILYDISGKRIKKAYTRNGIADFGKLCSGMYMYSVVTGKNFVNGGKIIIP